MTDDRTLIQAPRVRVAELSTRAEVTAASRLASRFWPRPSPGSPNTLRALSYSGNYVAGAFLDDRLVGACFGWLGRRHGRDLLFSRLNAVDPLVQDRGVGFLIKQHQRAWALERGIERVEWTFDPLLVRNAYFAICKLGADVVAYHPDFNGRGNDRVVAAWELRSAAAIAAAAGRARCTGPDALPAGQPLLAPGSDGHPQIGGAHSDSLMLCAVPPDRPQERGSWRAACRATMAVALGGGWNATGFVRPGSYILARVEGTASDQPPAQFATGA